MKTVIAAVREPLPCFRIKRHKVIKICIFLTSYARKSAFLVYEACENMYNHI